MEDHFKSSTQSHPSLEIKRNGLGADGKGYRDYETIMHKLKYPSWDRVFVIYDAIKAGISINRIHEITKIDLWFLNQYEELSHLEDEISKHNIESLNKELLLEAKQKGFADRQIAHMLKCLESQVYKKRKKLDINRVYKLVDTCAAEFKAVTPYYYSTFEEEVMDTNGNLFVDNESKSSGKKKIVVLGSGQIELVKG